MNFKRNRISERSLALVSALFSFDLRSTSFSFSVLFVLHFRIPRGERESDFIMTGSTDDDNTMLASRSCHYVACWPENPFSVSTSLVSGNSCQN